MKVFITRKQELTTSRWSGGTATQLAIYPHGTTLQERNFLFRISTARVEAETSTFTRLPGVRRVIMILDGQLELKHVGHYSKTLQKYETDVFSGDWETISRGKVTDFNLMTTGEATGTIEWVKIYKDKPIMFPFSDEGNVLGIYVLKGILNYQDGNENEILEPGSFLLAFPELSEEQSALKALEESEFVLVMIDVQGSL